MGHNDAHFAEEPPAEAFATSIFWGAFVAAPAFDGTAKPTTAFEAQNFIEVFSAKGFPCSQRFVL